MSIEKESGRSEENEKTRGFTEDLERLTRTELRAKYSSAYNSWRNSKMRAKRTHNWAPEFDDFVDFLRIMGPPRAGETLDRKDWANPLYAPGLVKWSSKREQANNRSTTRFVARDGKMLPAADAARADHIPLSTERQRHRRGLSPEIAFADFMVGVEERGLDPRPYRPWPRHRDDLPGLWERWFKENGGHRIGNNRYDFLIRKLKDLIGEADGDLREGEARGMLLDDPSLDDAWRRLGQSRSELNRALGEYPLWAQAVAKFERRLRAETNEKKALKGSDFLNFDDYEDD